MLCRRRFPVVGLVAVVMVAGACSSSPRTVGSTAAPATTAAPTVPDVKRPRPAPVTTTTVAAVPPSSGSPLPSPPDVGTGASAGLRIPDTSYPVPAGAVFMSPNGDDAAPGTEAAPVRSIRRAVALVPSGGTIVLRAGEHRTWFTNSAGSSYGIVDKQVTIQAYPHEQAWFNGADVVTGWRAQGAGRWSRSWSTPSFCEGRYYDFAPTAQPMDNEGPCAHQDMVKDPAFPVAGDPQMLFVDGVRQVQVARTDQVVAGTFAYDWTARTLVMGTDPQGHVVEAAARPVALVLGGYDSVVRGVGFHRFASNEQNNLTGAAVYVGGGSPTIESSVFADNAGAGLALSTPRPGSIITGSAFVANGANGLTVNGSSRDGSRNDLLIVSNVFRANNLEQFGRGCVAACTAGAIKLARMMGFVLRGNVIEDTLGVWGTGFWCDINCMDGVMVGNLVRNNGKYGIYYEVSSRAIVASNLVVGNAESGIMIGSATTRVYNNTVVVDPSKPLAEGITIYDDPRYPGNPVETGPNTTGIELVNNVISGTSGRLLAAHEGPGPNNSKIAAFFTKLGDNAYHSAGQNIINWASPNTSAGGRYFSSVASFRSATGFGQGSVDSVGGADPFRSSATGDFRLDPASPLAVPGSPLPADVAAAVGVSVGVPVPRGSLGWPSASW